MDNERKLLVHKTQVVNIKVCDLEFYYKGVFSVLEFIFLLHL